jgi:hypothetical protein
VKVDRPRRRRRYILIGALLLAVAAALVGWRMIPRDHAERATVREAVRLFQAAGKEGGGGGEESGGPWPRAGVYSYVTRGGESVSTPLLGGSHDYDGSSTVTVRQGTCGVIERWQVLRERWREAEGCAEGGDETARAVREVHEFFGSTQRAAYTCSGPASTDPANLVPGRRLLNSCQSVAGTVITKMSVSAAVPVAVEGKDQEALIVRGNSKIEGEEGVGTATFIDWRRRSDGLLLRRQVSSHIDSDDYGGMHYGETYELRLLSTTPQR